MKGIHKTVSVEHLCGLFGKTRQAYYKATTSTEQKEQRTSEILSFVREERGYQAKIGTDKLLVLLRQRKGIDIGRDVLYDLLRSHNLLIRKPKKQRRGTTDGDGNSLYPDLRKGLVVSRINQLWSCDITYFKVLKGRQIHCYATFIVDEYSHLIVGYVVAEFLTAQATFPSLQMALEKERPPADERLIFHTDRGSQFKSALFQRCLSEHRIRPSMTQDGKPSDNPVSERLNGILKNELLGGDTFEDFSQGQQLIDNAVKVYNTRRPHRSCEMLTPEQAHQKGSGPLKKLWQQRKAKPRSSRPEG